jgi:hypothetical protein
VPELWLCSVDALPITSPFPPVWVSDVDATDPAAGIHCGPIDSQWGRLAAGIAKRLLKITLP